MTRLVNKLINHVLAKRLIFKKSMIICRAAAANDMSGQAGGTFINSPFFLPLFTLMLHAIFNVLRAPIQMLICIFYSSKFFTTIGAHFSSVRIS